MDDEKAIVSVLDHALNYRVFAFVRRYKRSEEAVGESTMSPLQGFVIREIDALAQEKMEEELANLVRKCQRRLVLLARKIKTKGDEVHNDIHKALEFFGRWR